MDYADFLKFQDKLRAELFQSFNLPAHMLEGSPNYSSTRASGMPAVTMFDRLNKILRNSTVLESGESAAGETELE